MRKTSFNSKNVKVGFLAYVRIKRNTLQVYILEFIKWFDKTNFNLLTTLSSTIVRFTLNYSKNKYNEDFKVIA